MEEGERRKKKGRTSRRGDSGRGRKARERQGVEDGNKAFDEGANPPDHVVLFTVSIVVYVLYGTAPLVQTYALKSGAALCDR